MLERLWAEREIVLIDEKGNRFEMTLGDFRAQTGPDPIVNYLIGCAVMDLPFSVTTSTNWIILEKGEPEFVLFHEICHQLNGHAEGAKGIVCNLEDEMTADLYAAKRVGFQQAILGLQKLRDRMTGKGFWKIIRKILFWKGIHLVETRIHRLKVLSA